MFNENCFFPSHRNVRTSPPWSGKPSKWCHRRTSAWFKLLNNEAHCRFKLILLVGANFSSQISDDEIEMKKKKFPFRPVLILITFCCKVGKLFFITPRLLATLQLVSLVFFFCSRLIVCSAYSRGFHFSRGCLATISYQIKNTFFLLLARFPSAIIYSGGEGEDDEEKNFVRRAIAPARACFILQARFQLCNFIYWKLFFSSFTASPSPALFACWVGKTFSALFVFPNKVFHFFLFSLWSFACNGSQYVCWFLTLCNLM